MRDSNEMYKTLIFALLFIVGVFSQQRCEDVGFPKVHEVDFKIVAI
jgi:hypothetical protein